MQDEADGGFENAGWLQGDCRKESAGECPYRVTRRPPWLTPLHGVDDPGSRCNFDS
jgi:hypothetical protein